MNHEARFWDTKYLVVYEWAGTNYAAYLPDVPGCVATGATKDEAREHIRSVMRGFFRAAAQLDEVASEPRSFSEMLSPWAVEIHQP
jgi:predicted RNase H-like HicB family nuclease